MKPSPYRYVICACGTALIFISVGLLSNVFPIYFPFIMEIRGFSNTQVSLLTTMRSITALFSMFVSDRYYNRLNLKKGIALALCASVFSYAIYGCSSSPALYYLAALISGLGYGLGGMIPASVLIRRWFPVHTATAMGIAASGSGVASIIGPVLITSLIRRFGLSAAFLAESALMAICALPLVLLIKNEPELPQAQASGQSQALQKETASPRRELTRAEHLRVILGVFLIGTLGLTSFSGLSLLYTTSGRPVETVSLLLSFLGFVLIAGKCLMGWLSDRLGSFAAVSVFGAFLSFGQLMCCFAGSAPMSLIVCGLIFLGTGLALSTVALSVIASDFCSAGRYTTLLKTYQVTYALGGLISSAFPGMTADITGSYLPAYALFFLFSVLAVLLIAPVYKKIRQIHCASPSHRNAL